MHYWHQTAEVLHDPAAISPDRNYSPGQAMCRAVAPCINTILAADSLDSETKNIVLQRR